MYAKPCCVVILKSILENPYNFELEWQKQDIMNYGNYSSFSAIQMKYSVSSPENENLFQTQKQNGLK